MEKALHSLKDKIRGQTRLFGKNSITGEIALYILLRDYEETVEQVLGNISCDSGWIMNQIERRNSLSKKKEGELMIDCNLEQAFRDVGENGSIYEFACALFKNCNIPSYYFGSGMLEYPYKSFERRKEKDNGWSGKNSNKEIVVEHCTDWTYLIPQSDHVFFGREEELKQLMTVLMCRKKRNVLLIGEAGVGKTAIVEALADRIAKGNIPTALAGYRVLCLNLASLLGGASGRGDFEERVKNLVNNLENQEYPIILFIDEFHSIIGLGNEGNFDLANLLKPILARNKLSCIGATTYREYKLYVEKDGALIRRFQNIQVPEPSLEDTCHMLYYLKNTYEEYHKVGYEKEALKACVELTDKFIPNRRLPDKALDMMDEAGVKAGMFNKALVTREMIESLIAEKYHVCVGGREDTSRSRVKKLDRMLSEITGYYVEKEQLKKLLFVSQMVMGETGALNSIISFKGNSDLGSEKFIRAVRNSYFPLAEAYLELDLNGYQEKHMISKLIGAPPGYIGSQDSGILLDKLKKYSRILLVLRNLNNAHPQIIEFISKVLQGGMITDTYGNSVCMKNAVVIIDHCGSNTPVPFEMEPLICGEVEFHKLNAHDLWRLASEYFEKICSDIRKRGVEPEIHESVKTWLEECVSQNGSEKELRKYIYQNATYTLYELSIDKEIENKRIELYQDNEKLNYRIMEE